MSAAADPGLIGITGAGIVGGIALLVRGLGAYGQATRVSDTATSAISGIAMGEVRVSGLVEPAELTLVSPIQSRPCVYYRARVVQSESGGEQTSFSDERAVGFRVRDASGTIRVFPRGSRWDVPIRYRARDGMLGDTPIGLELRAGSAIRLATPDRASQLADLLTVHRSETGGLELAASGGRRQYEEARLEPGDPVTIVGTVLPFEQLSDPDGLDEDAGMGDRLSAAGDPEIDADLAAARAAGTLVGDAATAWGNAAIQGFGIGRPVRAPSLDPRAARPSIASAAESAEGRTFDISAGTLVLAAGEGAPLLIASGAPVAIESRADHRFIAGLAGAAIAIASAVALAFELGGRLG